MHDLKAMRQDPAALTRPWRGASCRRKGPAILKLDEERRAVQTELPNIQVNVTKNPSRSVL